MVRPANFGLGREKSLFCLSGRSIFPSSSSLDFARSSCFSTHSPRSVSPLCLPMADASESHCGSLAPRTEGIGNGQDNREEEWMDGWLGRRRKVFPPSVSLAAAAAAALRSPSLKDRASSETLTNTPAVLPHQSVGRLMHNPNLLQWQKREADVSLRRA